MKCNVRSMSHFLTVLSPTRSHILVIIDIAIVNSAYDYASMTTYALVLVGIGRIK